MALIFEFKANSIDFDEKAERFGNYKVEQKRHVDEISEKQSAIRQEMIEKGATPSEYEIMWQQAKPGDVIPKTGRGKYSRVAHVGKLANKSPARDKSEESKRLRARGKQYISMQTDKIMKAKEVM